MKLTQEMSSKKMKELMNKIWKCKEVKEMCKERFSFLRQITREGKITMQEYHQLWLKSLIAHADMV